MCTAIADVISTSMGSTVAACVGVAFAVELSGTRSSLAPAVTLTQPAACLLLDDDQSAEALACEVNDRGPLAIGAGVGWALVFWRWCAVSPVLHVVAVAVASALAFDWLIATVNLACIVIHVVPLPREWPQPGTVDAVAGSFILPVQSSYEGSSRCLIAVRDSIAFSSVTRFMGSLLLWCAVWVEQAVGTTTMQGHDVVDDEGLQVGVREGVVDVAAADAAGWFVFGDRASVPVADGGVAGGHS